MSPIVLFEEEAETEYLAAAKWYEAHRPGLGKEFLIAVDTAIRRIVVLPGVGAPVPNVAESLSTRRLAVTRFPYHVVYLRASDAIRILAIAHDRRMPGYWNARLP